MAIAECYLLKRDLTQCQDKCMDVLKIDRLNSEAHLVCLLCFLRISKVQMLADVQYLRNESDTALQKYSDVLSKHHCNIHICSYPSSNFSQLPCPGTFHRAVLAYRTESKSAEETGRSHCFQSKGRLGTRVQLLSRSPRVVFR